MYSNESFERDTGALFIHVAGGYLIILYAQYYIFLSQTIAERVRLKGSLNLERQFNFNYATPGLFECALWDCVRSTPRRAESANVCKDKVHVDAVSSLCLMLLADATRTVRILFCKLQMTGNEVNLRDPTQKARKGRIRNVKVSVWPIMLLLVIDDDTSIKRTLLLLIATYLSIWNYMNKRN